MELSPNKIKEFYTITISIAGVLFPVFQAILFFIVEKSFNRLQYTRQEMIGFYRKTGAIISICLIYLIFQPLLVILSFYLLSTILFWLFLIFIVIFRIMLLYSTGLWTTIFTTKFIPKTNRLMKFLITCWNNTFIEQIRFLAFLIVIIVIPLFSENTIFTSVFCVLAYTLIGITLLLNHPTAIQSVFLRKENSEDELSNSQFNWDEDKRKKEENALFKQVKNLEWFSQSEKKDKSNIFTYQINSSVKKNAELWINLNIFEMNISDIKVIKNRIFIITKEIFIDLESCKTDINSFALSFHFHLDQKKKNVFARTTKDEIQKNKDKDPAEFFHNLKNSVIDDILK